MHLVNAFRKMHSVRNMYYNFSRNKRLKKVSFSEMKRLSWSLSFWKTEDFGVVLLSGLGV